MSERHRTITEDEAAEAFACLLGFDKIVLAVSGGSDSLAMLYLVNDWRSRTNGAPDISVVTVDHQLRPESAAEAEFVSEISGRLRLPHQTLKWERQPLASGLMDAARDARYNMLDANARSVGDGKAVAVVTAHTLDDQAETFVMRLKRGSGVDGLSAMRRERSILPGSPIKLVRPLLAFPKTRLVATLQARGLNWWEDPTNADHHYERVRIRKTLAMLLERGVGADVLARSAERLGAARVALDYAVKQFEKTLGLAYHNDIYTSFERVAFSEGPALLREKVIASLISRHGGATPLPELREIEQLTAHIYAQDKAMLTLGGAVISVGPRLIRVWREAGRIDARDTRLPPGTTQLWDNRFWVKADVAADVPVLVRALGVDGFQAVSSEIKLKDDLPARAAHALPAFWSAGGELLAVPQLGAGELQNAIKGHFTSTLKSNV